MKEQRLVDLAVPKGWVISHHQLYDIDPDDPNRAGSNEMSIWAYFFVQDLLQIESASTLIDVGWYPEADPSGNFGVTVVGRSSRDSDWNWDLPLSEFETRSLSTLLSEIDAVLQAKT